MGSFSVFFFASFLVLARLRPFRFKFVWVYGVVKASLCYASEIHFLAVYLLERNTKEQWIANFERKRIGVHAESSCQRRCRLY